MSHFTVAVITDECTSVEELLEPYDERRRVAPYVRRTKADLITEARKRKMRYEKVLPEKPELMCDEYARKFLDAETDGELYQNMIYSDTYYTKDGDELSTYNPDSKWDWYGIGGRWNKLLRAKVSGIVTKCNSCRIGDLDMGVDTEEYQRSIRFWEVVIEGSPLKEGEKEEDFSARFSREYCLNKYHDKETYAKIASSLTTFAVITPDGRWYEKGEMGWCGMSSETPEEAFDWELHYKERFIDTADPDWTITIVDCHI